MARTLTISLDLDALTEPEFRLTSQLIKALSKLSTATITESMPTPVPPQNVRQVYQPPTSTPTSTPTPPQPPGLTPPPPAAGPPQPPGLTPPPPVAGPPQPPPQQAQPLPAAPATGQQYTLEHVRAGMKQVLDAGGTGPMLSAILQRYGVATASQLNPMHFNQVLIDCQLEIQKLTAPGR